MYQLTINIVDNGYVVYYHHKATTTQLISKTREELFEILNKLI